MIVMIKAQTVWAGILCRRWFVAAFIMTLWLALPRELKEWGDFKALGSPLKETLHESCLYM